MPSIDQIIQVNISQQTAAVAQASFSVPLIVGPTSNGWSGSDYVHVYSSAAAMLTDGYISSNPEYIYALELMAQPITPSQFMVGKRSAAVAQVDTLAVNTLTTSHAYAVTVNGVVYSYTAGGGDTQQAVLTALLALIVVGGAVTGAVAGTGGSALLTLTSTAPGAAVTYSAVDALLTKAAVTPNNGIATDIANILAQNGGWYGWCLAGATDADILQAAAWTEGQKKIFLGASSTSAIGTSSSTDVASKLQTAAYKRTALLFTPGAAAAGIEAAWLGGQLPQTPGSNNWAFKTLAGITADVLTDTQRNNAMGNPVAGTVGKNANIHTSVGGVNITEMGTMAGGQFIDITVGIDWLQSTLQTNIYSALVNAKKIPFTDAGVAILISAVRQALDTGVANTLIDPAGISITAPSVAAVSANQRAKRIAPTISFACRLQGAFNAVVISGTVTV
jgi:hypothetical protein